MASLVKESLAEGKVRHHSYTPPSTRVEEIKEGADLVGAETVGGQVTDQSVNVSIAPDPEGVKRQLRADEEARRARAHRRREYRAAEARNFTDGEALAVCQWIAAYQVKQGMQPLWSELRNSLGWSRQQTQGRLPSLRQLGWVTYKVIEIASTGTQIQRIGFVGNGSGGAPAGHGHRL